MRSKSTEILVFALAIVAIGMGAKSSLDSRVEALEKANSITLKSPDGKNTITIEAANEHVGIWLSRDNRKELIGIYSTQRENCIGMYPYNGGDKGKPIAIGVGLNREGKPVIQYQSKGGLRIVSPDEL